MRILTATLITETNTFSPMATGLGAFAEMGIFHGAREAVPETLFTAPMLLWRRMGRAEEHQVFESLAAFAQPAGKTVRAVYEDFCKEICDDVRGAQPLDAVLLNLHGAMVAEHCDDCEGELLSRIRELVGPEVTIGVELDPHCHLTDRMLAQADVIVTYKEYPHTDTLERAAELFRLTVDTARGKIRPMMAVAELPVVNLWSTVSEPMRGLVDRMVAREGSNGVLSLSFAHGFPWGDVPPGCARTLAIVDGDPAAAGRLARELTAELWAMRQATAFRGLSIDEAFDLALAADDGLTVIADTADNPGGGAPGDSTFVLERAVARGIRDIVIGPLWDPIAVRFCAEAGLGARIDLRVGGKCGPASGTPQDLRVIVRGCRKQHDQESPFGSGARVALGPSAWVEADGVHLVLCSLRMQTFSPSAYAGLGVPLARMRIAVPKSTNHFRAAFDPLAARTFYLAGPGAISADFRSFVYRNRSNDFWPRVEAPASRPDTA